jgi:hypothetical protein
MKLTPGVAWTWCRHHLLLAGAMAVVMAGGLLAPMAIAGQRDHDWVTYTIDRGVQAESVAASTTWIANGVTGTPSSFEYRFRAYEIHGASGAGMAWMVAGGLAMLWLARHSKGRNPWMVALLAVDILLIGCKVLSPQYFSWTAPLAAVVGGPAFVLHVVMAGLTLAAHTVVPGNTAIFAVVAVRNVILVGTVAWGLWRLRRPAPAPADIEAPELPELAVAGATRPA